MTITSSDKRYAQGYRAYATGESFPMFAGVHAAKCWQQGYNAAEADEAAVGDTLMDEDEDMFDGWDEDKDEDNDY